MFGETIDLMESLQITVLGMSVVFLVLVLLMGIIKIMEKASNRDVKKPAPAKKPTAEKPAKVSASVPQGVQGEDTELVAVIAAAAASCIGVAASSLVIRNIVRMPDTTPVWGLTGRADLMASRRMR